MALTASAPDKILYVVYLKNTPIGVHRWPWMAANEAKERSLEEATAHVVAFVAGYPLIDGDDFTDEAPTNPDCVPCSHNFPCDEAWKPGPV